MALRAEEIHDPGVVDLDRDRALVLRYQRGDDGAFDELYRRYFPRLHLYCQRRVGDPHASEELAQEAFVRALRAMPTFAGERRFYPWMTVIAQRLCIDHHRRTARVEPAAEVDLGIVEEGHDALYAEVDHGYLATAMERLAPRHREVLTLREQNGWSYQQIAEHLDVPITTVEALLHRARKALKREFLGVSSGSRLAAFPVVGWVVVRVARLRARVSGSSLSGLAPLAGSAAAGMAAVGLALSPFASTPDVQLAARSAVVTPASYSTTIATSAPSPLPITVEPTTTTAGRASRSDTVDPSLHAGAVKVYSGAAGTQAAQEAVAEQPVQVNVPGIVQVGVNPVQTLHDALSHLPGGQP